MTFWIFVLLYTLPGVAEELNDPVDGWLPAEAEARQLECERLSIEAARAVAPGQVPGPAARGSDFFRRSAVICRGRLIPVGARRAQDDAILTTLREAADEMASAVAALERPLRDRTWMVEVFYPDSGVSQKIAFAAKNALLDRGLRVTDRAPTLAAGDLEVIGLVPPAKAYPLACTRYAMTGSVPRDRALMALVLRHPRATILNVGVCADGRWRWIR